VSVVTISSSSYWTRRTLVVGLRFIQTNRRTITINTSTTIPFPSTTSTTTTTTTTTMNTSSISIPTTTTSGTSGTILPHHSVVHATNYVTPSGLDVTETEVGRALVEELHKREGVEKQIHHQVSRTNKLTNKSNKRKQSFCLCLYIRWMFLCLFDCVLVFYFFLVACCFFYFLLIYFSVINFSSGCHMCVVLEIVLLYYLCDVTPLLPKNQRDFFSPFF
jgi:hypothetical protein